MVDVPYVQRQSSYLISCQSLNQLLVGLFKNEQAGVLEPNVKKLKFIIRFSSKNQELNEAFVKSTISKLSHLEPLIVQSFKVFRKLHYQFKNFNSKLDGLLQNGGSSQATLIDKAVLGQIQYLSQRAFELSYMNSIQDCFKLLNTIVRELYNFDKVSILQYNQGQLQRLHVSTSNQS